MDREENLRGREACRGMKGSGQLGIILRKRKGDYVNLGREEILRTNVNKDKGG